MKIIKEKTENPIEKWTKDTYKWTIYRRNKIAIYMKTETHSYSKKCKFNKEMLFYVHKMEKIINSYNFKYWYRSMKMVLLYFWS